MESRQLRGALLNLKLEIISVISATDEEVTIDVCLKDFEFGLGETVTDQVVLRFSSREQHQFSGGKTVTNQEVFGKALSFTGRLAKKIGTCFRITFGGKSCANTQKWLKD